MNAAGSYPTSLSNKPAGSMTTAEVIAKYGPIGTWDTSQVINMALEIMNVRIWLNRFKTIG